MSEQIKAVLKRKIDGLAAYGGIDAETRRNALKEELQFYVLNFIYHHPEHGRWIMYGGSALRIIHGLDRMSVDLDFEISHAVTEKFLEELKKETEDHFKNTYGAEADFLTIKIATGRGLILKFHVGEELSFGHPSKQVHVKIDLNHFVAPKTVTERRPINRDQLSFVITTYNMGALMASKIAAIFLREQRGVDKNIYDYKGRDIYDLLWYMDKKAVPDFDYLNAKLKEKGLNMRDIKMLFDEITVKILNYEKMDDCLKDDLGHLFEDSAKFDSWLKNWRESYLRLLDDYKINTVTNLADIKIHEHSLLMNYSFTYTYNTVGEKFVYIRYIINDYWIIFKDVDGAVEKDKKLDDKIKFFSDGQSSKPDFQNKLKRYATLFYQKTEDYLKKTNRIMVGDGITTKIIRINANNLNLKEEILLNESTLRSRELDDLLK